jgi:hypothetical protein
MNSQKPCCCLTRKPILGIDAAIERAAEAAVLRVIEALRMHAAGNEGQLPEKLGDIPDDPVTGEPFSYRLEAGNAYLQGPTLRDVPLNYEITMARPE